MPVSYRLRLQRFAMQRSGLSPARRGDPCLEFYRYSLQFEARAEEQRPGAEKRARRKLFSEERPIDGIKPLEQRNVRAEDLHENEVIHRKPNLVQRAFYSLKQ